MEKYSLKIIFLLFILCTGIYSCSKKTEEKSDNKTNNSDKNIAEKIQPIKTIKLQKTKIDRTLDYTSNIVAFEQVYFAPSAPGGIDKIFVEIGDYIKKGQQIIRMDNTQLQQADIQLKTTEIEFNRIKKLKETGSISEQQYDQMASKYELAKINVEYLRQNVFIKSPISGIVTEKFFEDKEMFSGAPNNIAGKAAIIVIEQINPVKALVNISETYFPMIKKGLKVAINSDIFTKENFEGYIDKIHPTLNSATRTFTAEVKIPNKKNKLRPGMFTRIEINVGQAEALIVPAYSVLQQEGTNDRYIYINNNGIAKKIFVQIGKRFNDKLEIISDELSIGDEIIVAGHASLENNQKVVIKN